MVLDEQQQKIVETPYSAVLVSAASGSGKTAVLTERIRYLLDNGVDPTKIVAITFTNAAAEEMVLRIGEKAKDAFIGTIHSYANRLLVKNGWATNKYIEEEMFDLFFDKIKRNLYVIEEVEHLLVDEFQDISDIQYEFFMDMIKPKNFFFIGDTRQAIFQWAGANLDHFYLLAHDPDVEVYSLVNNYRSGINIINFADQFLKGLKDIRPERIISKNPIPGEVIKQSEFDLDAIIDKIEGDGNYKKWFILARSNDDVDFIRNYLIKNRVPAESFKKKDFTNAEIKAKIEDNTVKVLTVHSAKGLENDNVVVVGVVPYNKEEKRVAYVAATRAKNRLIWVYRKKKKRKTKIEYW